MKVVLYEVVISCPSAPFISVQKYLAEPFTPLKKANICNKLAPTFKSMDLGTNCFFKLNCYTIGVPSTPIFTILTMFPYVVFILFLRSPIGSGNIAHRPQLAQIGIPRDIFEQHTAYHKYKLHQICQYYICLRTFIILAYYSSKEQTSVNQDR